MTPPPAPQLISATSRLAVPGAVFGVLAGMFIIVTRTASPPVVFIALMTVVMQAAVLVAAWWAAAAGWGWLIGQSLRRIIGGDIPGAGAGATPLGLGPVELTVLGGGKMLMLLWLAGWAGWFTPGMAWTLGGVGWLFTAVAAALWLKRQGGQVRIPPLPWTVILPGIAAGLLIGATAFAPSGLWDSEAGGYDVLSYHLQLPREWIADGAILGYHHNVYSYLPSLWEVAYAQLGLWQGSMVEASYAAQLLHATMALAAAAIIGRLVALCLVDAGRDAATAKLSGALAAAVYIAVPWTMVTGSLAYNEQAMMAFGAVAFLIALRAQAAPLWAGVIIGACCALSTLAKISAPLGIAIPVGVLVLIDRRGGPGAWWRRCAGLAIGFTVVFAPWLIRNALWTGNPLFPVAMEAFGSGHWTAEQVARWQTALAPRDGRFDVASLWRELLWHVRKPSRNFYDVLTVADVKLNQFGYIVIPAALLVGIVTWLKRRDRAVAMLGLAAGVQVLAWLLFSHHQGRFLIPLLIPAAAIIGIAAGSCGCRWRAMIFGTLIVLACTAIDVAIYYGQREVTVNYLDGLDVKDPGASNWAPNVWSVVNSLPLDSRVYAEGFATPYYMQRPTTYHTVWDASPLGEALAQGPAAAKQWLLDRGYTHIVIEWAMMRRYWSPGNYGYDPRIAIERLSTLSDMLEPVYIWNVGEVLNQGVYAVR